jgi:hypothetical protein
MRMLTISVPRARRDASGSAVVAAGVTGAAAQAATTTASANAAMNRPLNPRTTLGRPKAHHRADAEMKTS